MSLIKHLSAAFFCLFLGTSAVLAVDYQSIDAAAMKRLIDTGGALVVNPMTPIEFDHEHIPGSVNIPMETLASMLPGDKQAPVAFYCLGEHCIYSWRAAKKAVDLGYTKVYAFHGGLRAWKAAGYPISSTLKLPKTDVQRISTEKLAEMLAKEELVLLDINDSEDAEKLWVDTPKRVNIPLAELKERYAILPKNKQIVIICLKGQRGPTAVRYLKSRGYENISVVDGGIVKWVLEGRPTRKGK